MSTRYVGKPFHWWLNNLREQLRMLSETRTLPHFYRNPDGAPVTTCDECRRAYRMRRQYKEVNGLQ